jgi:hypothetical protein
MTWRLEALESRRVTCWPVEARPVTGDARRLEAASGERFGLECP